MPRAKFVSWSVLASVAGGAGLVAYRRRYRNALAEIDRQRLEGDAEAERLRLRLATVTRSEPTAVASPASTGDSRGEPPEADDLKAIKGIGPAIERALNDLGITRYEQIAAFTAEDRERVAAALGGLGRRLDRDDWVGSARRLAGERQR